MFIDRAKILVRSGAGGDGAVMWRREKYVAAGGPAGGDGGRGGSVALVATTDLNTLLDFRFNRKFIADPGERGGPKNMHGRGATDLEIRVPVGTVIYDESNGAILADLHEDGMRYTAVHGGRGGHGNAHFATPTRKAPDFAEPGKPGEEKELALELKLLADVGLVGLPNAGKSTLIANVSAARPKIADYPFTTLEPQLGVVRFGPGETLVVADIPGLVEGASAGIGLGHDFLRHVERCRVLVHLLDPAGGFESRDAITDFDIVNAELAKFRPELAERPMLVALTKQDLPEAREAAETVGATLTARGLDVFHISSATREGLDTLLSALRERVAALPPPTIYTPTPVVKDATPPTPVEIVWEPTVARDHRANKSGPGVWKVVHARLERQISTLDLESPEAVVRLHRLLDDFGVIDKLRELGVDDGDTVSIGGFEFDFVD